MHTLSTLPHAVIVGVGATALMDIWLLLLQRAGVPTMDFALLGRWVGHLCHGQFAHDAIRRAPAIRGERTLGWLTHYVVGIVFAAMLVALQGELWLHKPSLLPALAWGLATAAAPLLLLQPAMGAGIASSRTPAPLKNGLRSLVNHAVFGLGLFVSASTVAALTA
ncbi:MAG: DUF2938 family protein [Rubrivivax sp.]|nr:DUF2938 family protein [Rubrivivax sp.]